MSFNFNITAGSSQNTAKSRLTGNEIYTVKFDGCEIVDINGVKEPGKVYKVVKLKFSNDVGYFEHSVFEPRPEDFVRGKSKYTDRNTGEEKEITQPSSVENMMLLFKHAIDAINPTIAKQIDDGTKQIAAANWEELRQFVAKILNVGKGITTQIKLVKDNKGEAKFPSYFSTLKKDSVTGDFKADIKNNFIGEKLAFTTYEATKIQNEANAAPTRIATSNRGSEINTTGSFPDLGNDLSFEIGDL